MWFFSSNIIKTPQVIKTQSIEKKRERKRKIKYWKKRERKAPWISSNKRGSHYFERRKTLHLSPPASYHFKNLFQINEKVFVTLFGPSFSLVIYMTWVVPFLLTHELHIYNL
jgi:hypothetical protein